MIFIAYGSNVFWYASWLHYKFLDLGQISWFCIKYNDIFGRWIVRVKTCETFKQIWVVETSVFINVIMDFPPKACQS